MEYAVIGAGLLLLVVGGETVLRGGVGLSRALGLSPLLIGLLVISAGTSAPELVVALRAASHHAPDIALGNLVGSNIVNILLMLGLGALMRPIPSPPKLVFRDGGVMLAASIALVVIAQQGVVTRQIGLYLLAAFATYIVLCFFTDWRRPAQLSISETRAFARLNGHDMATGLALFLLAFGLICLFFGARFVVSGGVAIARDYHIPEDIIGLTVIAFGTSLPELTTTVVASARGQTSIAIGHLIGSNIYNILGVLGLTAFLYPMPVSHEIAGVDVFVMAGAAALIIPLAASGWRITRWQGAFLTLCYFAYIASLAWRMGYVTRAMVGM